MIQFITLDVIIGKSLKADHTLQAPLNLPSLPTVLNLGNLGPLPATDYNWECVRISLWNRELWTCHPFSLSLVLCLQNKFL